MRICRLKIRITGKGKQEIRQLDSTPGVRRRRVFGSANIR